MDYRKYGLLGSCLWYIVFVLAQLSIERKKIFLKHRFIELMRCSTIPTDQGAPIKLKSTLCLCYLQIFVLLQI